MYSLKEVILHDKHFYFLLLLSYFVDMYVYILHIYIWHSSVLI